MLSHSQNFINNIKLVKELAGFIDSQKSGVVIEIGPGEGIITDILAEKYSMVLAIEADNLLSSELRRRYVGNNVEVITSNFLNYPLPHYEFDVFSNIPFNITADIIKKITDDKSNLKAAYLIIQKEAAEKIAGWPCGESSLLSNILKTKYDIEILRQIHRANFTPRPKVDIVFLRIKRKENAFFQGAERSLFQDFISFIYNRSKPVLYDALKSVFSNLQLKIIFRENNISQALLIKKTSFKTWIQIFESFLKHAPEKSKSKVKGSYSRLLQEQYCLRKIHRTRRY